MNHSFEYISNLQYCLKTEEKQPEAFRSGEKYVPMTQEHPKSARAYERQIRKPKRKLEQAHREIITVRNMWFEVFEDLEAEQEGVKGTVTEDYQGILVHDHESTFYKYGSDHQECMAHVQRYPKDKIQ